MDRIDYDEWIYSIPTLSIAVGNAISVCIYLYIPQTVSDDNVMVGGVPSITYHVSSAKGLNLHL